MNHTLATYKSMADFIGLYLSGHPKEPLAPGGAVIIGVLAAIANVQHGNNVRGQWEDIFSLSKSALQICDATEPEPSLFDDKTDTAGGNFGSSEAANLAAQGKEICTLANSRTEDAPLTAAEVQAAYAISHILTGATLARPDHDNRLIHKAHGKPFTLTLGEFVKLIALAH